MIKKATQMMELMPKTTDTYESSWFCMRTGAEVVPGDARPRTYAATDQGGGRLSSIWELNTNKLAQ